MAVTITKETGEREAFDQGKLQFTLQKAGASEAVQQSIIARVESELIEGMPTRAIYRRAFNLLRKEAQPVAIRYSMRRAVLDFGPTGFPFETFVGEIFKMKGYTVLTDQLVRGRCVEHEVDLVARKEGECIAAELKFHNALTTRSDVQVALYVHARFEDLKGGRAVGNTFCIDRGMLITNTKFTSQAIQYGKCVDLSMIGWNFPNQGNLHDLINETKVHPVTALTTLSRHEKAALLAKRIVLARDLPMNEEALRQAGLSSAKMATVLEEVKTLYS
jgi:hypothetical protein